MADNNAELRANTGSQEEMISGQDDSVIVSPGKQDDNMLKHNTDTEDVKEKIHCAENEFFNNKSDNNVEGSNSSSASVTCTHTSDSKSSETLDNAEGKCSGNVSVTGTEESDSESSEYESAEEDQNIVEDEHEEEDIEEVLTEEVKKERRSQAQVYKDEGNDLFKKKEYDLACKQYSKALRLCPKDFVKDRSIMYSNRAACKMKKELNEEAIKDSTKALELHPHYMKALIRRAELYEKVDRLEEALADYQRAVELDPTQHGARAACMRLPDQIKEKNEKLKEEMLGKLKELGNMVLKPFGLSTNNFQMNQDPKTGGYSINFKQNS